MHEGVVKKVWVKAVPWDAAAVAAAIESGADAVVVEEGRTAEVRRLGRIQTVAPDGDLRIGEDVVEVEIGGKADEEEALRLSRAKTVVVRCADWTIIPLENLIAQTRGLFAEVKNLDEALTAVRLLEKGVDGIVLHAADPAQIRETVREARRVGERVELVTARVTGVERCGTGEAVIMTGLPPKTIARGKFLSAFTNISMYIVMLAPVGALSFLFGGVTAL